MIETVEVTRYVTPLREGGSLPGVVEAADLGTYVCKFRGAGQGVKVLVAEVIVSALARALEVATPRLVALDLPAELARYEADEEVQDLLRASVGLNVGVDFLPGAFGFDATGGAAAEQSADEAALDFAATVLWLDAFTGNPDRTWRNPNLLRWHGRIWLIDHGASLYFHHAWTDRVGDPGAWANRAWSDEGHVFGAHAASARRIDASLRARVADAVSDALADVPDAWLTGVGGASPEELRDGYARYLGARLESTSWLPGEPL
ncbi:MAG: HipA family kinase [Nocardioides sp.]